MKNGKSRLVIVAGGAGFLGSHLCDRLIADGDHVLCIDNFQTGRPINIRHLERDPRFDLLEWDIIAPFTPRQLRTIRPAAIFNLACAASPPHYQADPEHTMLTSVVGTSNLLRLCESAGARFLLASTSEVYGDPDVHPQIETYWGNVNPTGPRACYDEGKRSAEALAFDFLRAGRADVRIARIFNTYGPRMRADDGRVISNVITQALTGQPITIYGDGDQTRSFCYVSDLVDGLVRLMAHERDCVSPVNLGNPHELMVRDLVGRVLAMTGSRSSVVMHPLPVDDPRRRKPDISKARENLDWQPKISLEAGLSATIAWFAEDIRRTRPRTADHRTAEPLNGTARSAGHL